MNDMFEYRALSKIRSEIVRSAYKIIQFYPNIFEFILKNGAYYFVDHSGRLLKLQNAEAIKLSEYIDDASEKHDISVINLRVSVEGWEYL